MTRVTQELIDAHFGDWEHPYRTFQKTVEQFLPPVRVLVDVGCGRTAPVLRRYLGRGIRLIGLDCIPFEDTINGIELYTRDICQSGLPTACADLIMARSVMEHVADPTSAYKEMNRILRANGIFVFLTPNLWDYASLVAKAVPNRYHPSIVRHVEGRAEHDVFPTYFRSNTRRTVQRLAQNSGFVVEGFEYLGQYPSYLLFNHTLFLIGTAYEKFLANHKALHWLRGWLLVTLRKVA